MYVEIAKELLERNCAEQYRTVWCARWANQDENDPETSLISISTY